MNNSVVKSVWGFLSGLGKKKEDNSRRLEEKEKENQPGWWDRFISWVKSFFKKDEPKRMLTDKEKTSTDEKKPAASTESKSTDDGDNDSFVTKAKNKIMSVFGFLGIGKSKSSDSRVRVLAEKLENDPIEILMSRISKDYGGLVKKLNFGFTNDQVKEVTGDYLQFLKDELQGIETEQNGWIEDSTSQLDDLRNNLNEGEISVDNYDQYMENLRTSWKAKADEEVNLESASKLNALADSIEDYKTRLNEKIPTNNALNAKVNSFLDAYKGKIIEVAGFLNEKPENVDELKNQLKKSVDKIVDDNKEFGKDKKEEAVEGFNKIKALLNTTLFKSLNEDNLKYILHSVVAGGSKDVDRLKDPNKPSNFFLERKDMKEFSTRVSDMVKDMTANNEKVAWNMRTKEAQKVMDDGKTLVKASSDGSKVINLESIENKLKDINNATTKAIEDKEIKTKLNDLITDSVNYDKINKSFDTSGAKNTELYNFLTNEITDTSLSTPSRILHALNKEELKAAGKLSRSDRDSLKFVRKLLAKWEEMQHEPEEVVKMMSNTFRVISGNSTRNLKFAHKFDIASMVQEFKTIYGGLTKKVDSGIETSNKLTGTIDSGKNRLTDLTKHLEISKIVGTEKSWFANVFSFLPWIKKDPEEKRLLMDFSAFTKMKDSLVEAKQNAEKMTAEVQSARDFTKKFEEGFEILKKFS